MILLKLQLLQSVFYFILFLFYTLFCSFSQNKLSRQDVPFIVIGHTFIVMPKTPLQLNMVPEISSHTTIKKTKEIERYYWLSKNQC